MLSRTTEAFRAQLVALPKAVQDKAASTYALWAENPHHPSLRFKKVHSSLPIYSERIDRAYRAVGVCPATITFAAAHDVIVAGQCGSGLGPMPTTKPCCEDYKVRPTRRSSGPVGDCWKMDLTPVLTMALFKDIL